MIDKSTDHLSLTTLRRLPVYLRYLRNQSGSGVEYLSSVAIAKDMNLSPMVVKKDLAVAILTEGKPRVGYHLISLIKDIETYLGYSNKKDAVIVGVGQLGRALMSYEGFANYGLNIVVGFDTDETIHEVAGKKVLMMDKFTNLVQRLNIHIGIITVPKELAQHVAELMVNAGIKAIWNWAPVTLQIPDDIVVKQEDLAASLAVLSVKLDEIL